MGQPFKHMGLWEANLFEPLLSSCDPSNSWLWTSTSVFARPRHSLTRDIYIWDPLILNNRNIVYAKWSRPGTER
jgi:hypothetical protein